MVTYGHCEGCDFFRFTFGPIILHVLHFIFICIYILVNLVKNKLEYLGVSIKIQ